MRKIFLILTVLLLSLSAVMAQESHEKSKKEVREARKEAQKQVDERLAKEAWNAVNDRHFVLLVDKVSFVSGATFLTNSRFNFIILEGDKATVQLASPSYQLIGPNGLGGITVEGSPTNYTAKMDKRGNLYLSMFVQGVAISAQVTITIPRNSDRGVATVSPSFNPLRITMKGIIRPIRQSDIYEGKKI